VEYKVNEVRSQKAAYIDKVASPEAKAEVLAKQFPKGSWFEVYDYGVGDEVIWPYAISVTRTGSGVYQVKSPVPVTLNLPDAR
jgi:exo-beta-1,3-glucanase (GH17 family)